MVLLRMWVMLKLQEIKELFFKAQSSCPTVDIKRYELFKIKRSNKFYVHTDLFLLRVKIPQ